MADSYVLLFNVLRMTIGQLPCFLREREVTYPVTNYDNNLVPPNRYWYDHHPHRQEGPLSYH